MPNRLFLKLSKYIPISAILITLTARAYAGFTPPTTTSTLDPAIPDGKNDWYVTAVEVTLDATDLESGVAQTNYRLNEGNWVTKTFAGTLNLAPNPSFEVNGVTAPLNTNEWQLANPADSATFVRTTSEYATGYANHSISIGSTSPGWHAINHKNNFAPATPFKNMSATVMVKTATADLAYFKIFLVSLDALNNPVYTEIAQSTAISGTSDWIKLTSSFVVNSTDAIGIYIEPGLEGTGEAWFDAITLNESVTEVSVDFTVGADGEYLVDYFSVDRVGNTEPMNFVEFKIDQTPPSTWEDGGAYREQGGGSFVHELYVFVTVEDITSGLSDETDKYQYHVDVEDGFGYHDSLRFCNTEWHEGGWLGLYSDPVTPGSNTYYMVTPRTDFCNSNWKICKTVRFYAEDMAGNWSTKDMCLNGPWIRFRGGGIVGARTEIEMIAEPEDPNTDALIETEGLTVNFFSSEPDWVVKNYNNPRNASISYEGLQSMTSEKTTISDGELVTTSGIYRIEGDFEIDGSSVPNDYDNATFDQIVFINGNLLISDDIEIDEESTAFFVVAGNVQIAEDVTNVGVSIHADGNFDTAYNADIKNASKQLVLNGIFSADKFNFQRTLQGANNNDVPSEDFIYEPKYLTHMKDFFTGGSVRWIGSR